MKLAMTICAFLVMSIIASDNGAERRRMLAEAKIRSNYAKARRI